VSDLTARHVYRYILKVNISTEVPFCKRSLMCAWRCRLGLEVSGRVAQDRLHFGQVEPPKLQPV